MYEVLTIMSFVRTKFDYSVFVHFIIEIIIEVYVDDLLLIDFDINDIREIKKSLMSQFEMINLESMKHYLDMKIVRNRQNRIIKFIQITYLKNMLTRFEMIDSHSVTTSITKYLIKINENYVVSFATKKMYAATIKSLM